LVALILTGCVGTMSFPTIEPTSFRPSGMAPNDFIEVDSLTPTFTWRHPNFTEMDEIAIWQVAPDGSPGETFLYEKNVPGGQYTLKEPLTPGEEYFWSVRPTGSFVWAKANYVGVSPLGAAWQNGVPFRIKAPLARTPVPSSTPNSIPAAHIYTPPVGAPPENSPPGVSSPGSMPPVVVESSSLQTQPICLVQAHPIYPVGMRAINASGVVLVDFIVTPEGKVVNAFASKSSRPEFESAALDAVRSWIFIPGKVNGNSVYTHMQVPMVFDLTK
jgi:TonB family protein